jgi:serine/threonine-protein kinase
MWMDVDGGGGTGVVPGTTGADYPAGPGADPDTFLMVRIDAETGGDVYLASISGAFQPRALIKTPTYEGGPQFSPEHRWLLYQSNESGQPEIYLRPYPALTPTYPVSAGGGVQARFARTGKEIYFRSGGRMMAVSADLSGNVPVLGKPAALFEDVYNFGTGISVPNYDVAADGRFVMTRSELDSGRLHVVRNWTVELRQLLIADPR